MKYTSFVATITFATLVLVGCGTNVMTPTSSSISPTSSAVASTVTTDTIDDSDAIVVSKGDADMGSVTSSSTSSAISSSTTTEDTTSTSSATTTQTRASVETVPTSSVEVIELTSSTITYDGERGRANGRDIIQVTLTVDGDGIITDVSLSQSAAHGESRRYQSAFASAIGGQVVGKTVDQATVGKVGGASYTSDARNKAIATL
ncbi:MAG: hypothetical protein H6766_07665 [Candidatus Peribacteria bacterium]|nr:MAG: hypothetical protein H6766_07665 [Candidatus Peribacteria bacterium]